VRSLHAFFTLNFDYARRPIIHIMDAITKLFDTDLILKYEVIKQLTSYKSQMDGKCQIISFFEQCVFKQESELKNYKATETFLRLLCKIWKSDYP